MESGGGLWGGRGGGGKKGLNKWNQGEIIQIS